MKYFLLNSIKRIKQYSQQLDTESVLSNKSWYVFSDTGEKIVFMFRSNAELLIVVNGKVNKGKWELLPNKALLIDMGSESYLYNSAFVENQLLALNLDGANDCLIMIEEGLKNQLALNSVDKIDKYLENKYIIQPELELRRKKEEEEKIRLEEANRLKLIAEEKEIQKIQRKQRDREEELYFQKVIIFCISLIFVLILTAPILLYVRSFNVMYGILSSICFPLLGAYVANRITTHYIGSFGDEIGCTLFFFIMLIFSIYTIIMIITF